MFQIKPAEHQKSDQHILLVVTGSSVKPPLPVRTDASSQQTLTVSAYAAGLHCWTTTSPLTTEVGEKMQAAATTDKLAHMFKNVFQAYCENNSS